MENFKEIYVLGQPIETPLGDMHFFKVKDYPILMRYGMYLNLEKSDILEHLSKYQDLLSFSIFDAFKDMSFLELINSLSEVIEVHSVYKEIFEYVFKKDVFNQIKTDEELIRYRLLIQEMNCIHKDKKNPNAEIEYFNQLKKLYHKKKNKDSNLTFESLYTSVWLELGYEPLELTIYQLHALFNRVAQFKSYDTTVLYSTVAEKVTIEPWYKHVGNADENETTLDEFGNYAKQILGE